MTAATTEKAYRSAMSKRRTIAREIACEGTALHAGTQVRMLLAPAGPNVGVVFRRSDLDGAQVPARYDAVSETTLGTTIEAGRAKVAVIEHLMAAVSGAGIDDLVGIVDGPEPPVLDGDALFSPLGPLPLLPVPPLPVPPPLFCGHPMATASSAAPTRVGTMAAAAYGPLYRFETMGLT